MIYIHFFLKQIVKNTHASKAEQTDTLWPTVLPVKYSIEMCPHGHQKACQEFLKQQYSQ